MDNVPLLVSLFTESTPVATREMVSETSELFFLEINTIHSTITVFLNLQIKIMQDYGEVVCIVGSSASAYNCAIFMQADARYVQ